MPVVSEAQRRAMEAAKHGHSTLGIPKDVAAEFLAKDAAEAKGHAAGVLHVAPDGSVLLLHRAPSEENYAGHWALPGGKADDEETPEECADRECREEIGYKSDVPLKLLDQRMTPNGMAFHTFVRPTFDKFAPKLNEEHSGFTWARLDMLPHPLHPAVARTLEEKTGGDGEKLQKWAHAGGDRELASDEMLAFDRAPDGFAREGLVVTIAFDKDSASVRQTDDFERLHVRRTPISKAGVNKYYGREIPKFKELGLEPDRLYKLLRDPEELKKGATTFNNLPLLSQHIPHTADAHNHEATVGTVGSDAEYEHPYLYNSLGIWSRGGIDHVENGTQKELSSAYGYDADMTPGEYEGEAYDGVMRNLKGNHVALVKKGRAGSDVVVGDEALQPQLEIKLMSKLKSLKAGVALGAIRAHLLGVKLAQDAAIDLTPAFEGVKAGKFGASKKAIVAGVRKALTGKLAQDGDLAGIVAGVEKLIEAVDTDKTVEDEELTPEDKEGGTVGDPDDQGGAGAGELDEEDTTMDDGMEAVKKYLASKGVDPEIIAGIPGPTAEDAGTAGPEGAGPNKEKKEMDVFDKGAMDAAIAKARTDTIATMNAIAEAKEAVRPVVGEIKIAMDSAVAVYQKAFAMAGRAEMAKVKDLTALKSAWGLVPVPGAAPRRVIAQDSAVSGDDFAKRFPNAAKVRRV